MDSVDSAELKRLVRQVEILKDFVEADRMHEDRFEIAELSQYEWEAYLKEKQADRQRDLRAERRIKRQHAEVRVCDWCSEKFVVVVGKRGKPRMWHNDKCRKKILTREAREAKSADNT